MIWRSPPWMPLASEIVAVQFGYIGLRLRERFGKTGLLLIGLLGAVVAGVAGGVSIFVCYAAVQYASQALAVKGVSPDSTKLFQQHLALFQQRKPIRS